MLVQRLGVFVRVCVGGCACGASICVCLCVCVRACLTCACLTCAQMRTLWIAPQGMVYYSVYEWVQQARF